MRSLSLVLGLAACGGASDDPAGDAPASQPCVPADDTTQLTGATSWQLGATAVDDAGTWFVLAKQHDEVTDFVIADATGELSAPITGIANASGATIATVNLDGKRCFAMHTFDENFHFVCEGGSVEIPDLELGGKMSVVADGSTIHAFGQDFAAYHELRRTGGTWAPVEKFESSISKAEDAVLSQGNVVSCFLSTGDNASLDTLSGDPIYGDGTATWCRLLPDGNSLGVLTDLGFTTFTGGTLGNWQPTAVDVRPLAVGTRAGSPFAVIRRADRVELQPLPTGTPTVLLTASAEMLAVIDNDRVIVTSLRSIFEAGATRYELTRTTRCLD